MDNVKAVQMDKLLSMVFVKVMFCSSYFNVLSLVMKYLWNETISLMLSIFWKTFLDGKCSDMWQNWKYLHTAQWYTMCWHRDIAKFQILVKTVSNQCLGIQYDYRVVNLHFFCIFNGNLINLNMTLLTKKVIFYHFYIVKF